MRRSPVAQPQQEQPELLLLPQVHLEQPQEVAEVLQLERLQQQFELLLLEQQLELEQELEQEQPIGSSSLSS